MTTTEISSERLDELIRHTTLARDEYEAGSYSWQAYQDRLSALTELRDRRAAGGEAVAWRGDGENEFGSIRKFTAMQRVSEIWADQGLTVTPLYLHPSNRGVAVPEGWALVPKTPTDEMLQAFEDEYVGLFGAAPGSPWSKGEKLFTAMVDAAPSPDTGKSQDEEGTWSDGGKEWTPAVAEVVITDEMVERLRQSAFSEAGIWCPSTGQCRTMLNAALKGDPDGK